MFNVKVLVIDDEEIVRENILDILTPKKVLQYDVTDAANLLFDEPAEPTLPNVSNIPQFEVHTASSGKEGFELVKRSIQQDAPYAVIFCDMRMPGWDGLETIMEIRKLDPLVEIIFITAYSDRDIHEIVDKAGHNVGYHCKPFASEEILQLATKAVSDYNKLRNLESLINIISTVNIGSFQLNKLLQNILDQLSTYLDTNVAFLGKFHQDNSYESLVSIGRVKDVLNVQAISQIISNSKVKDDVAQVGDLLFVNFNAYSIFAILQIPKQIRTEKRFLIKLFVKNAALAIRSAELNEKLLEKEKLSVIGNAMGMLMHDLRGPIKNIKVLSDFLKEEFGKHELLHAIDTCADEAGSIFDDFRDFINENPIRKQSVNLERLVVDLAKQSADLQEHNTVRVEIAIESHLEVSCDENKLKRILSNLLNNAYEILISKQIPNPLIKISGYKYDDNLLAITIKDNGPGIPEKILPTIFEPFVTHGKSDGTGLGLAIVKQFVEAHGGTITVHNDHGAIFTIKLPV